MSLFKKISKWWKKNQEENSEEYLERESLRKDLIDFEKTLRLFSGSGIANSNGEYLERLILIQNMRMQKKMNSATNGLKIATWILALATIVFAWVAIKDSNYSSEIVQTLLSILGIIASTFIFLIGITLIWQVGKFILKFIIKIIKKGRK